MNCPGCLTTHQDGFCADCLIKLFDGKAVSAVLPFDPPGQEDAGLYFENVKRISISGVQTKYALRLEDNQLRLTDRGGQYLLKPIPFGQFKNLDQAPANEHLTMQIAQQVYGIVTPANALVYFQDQSPAYLVRRFDIKPNGGKYQQEDFAQLAQVTAETHGLNYKYDLSYEAMATLVRRYVTDHDAALEAFFRLVLFNYVFSNGDAHVKNFSIIEAPNGGYALAPAYDLLCTRLYVLQESDMALALFEEGFSPAYEAYGFYTYDDFLTFGQHLGIEQARVEEMIDDFRQDQPLVMALIDRSFLRDEMKQLYKDYYYDKVKRLAMKFTK